MTEIGESVAVALPAVPAKAPPHKPGHLKFTSKTVATAPANRARLKIGVGEKVKLKITGATGSISWSITGSSKLSATAGTSVTLTVHERAEKSSVTATDSCGCKEKLTFDVIEPSGVKMEPVPGKNVWHQNGIPSVGIMTNIYITPDTVSFEEITISEDDCGGAVTGYFVGTALDGVRHAGHGAGSEVGVGAVVAGKGSKVQGQDTAQSGSCNFGTPYAAGTFDWPIPWLFKVGGGAFKKFATVHQRFTIDASGDMTVSKAGATGSTRMTDANSSY